jgi:thiol:disulfide interchange protein DsbD
LFGALMLGVAAWMLARLVGDRASLLLYCVPLIAIVVVLWKSQARGAARAFGQVVALGAAASVVLLGVGYARGATDPLHPLAAPGASQAAELPFLRVNNIAELDRAVQAASASGRAVMLDFYADWCTSCKEMERYTFSNRQVHDELAKLTLLRADVTANNADDQALLKRFGIFGPPTIAFYGKDGNEHSNFRVVGYMKAAEFAQIVSRATSAGG